VQGTRTSQPRGGELDRKTKEQGCPIRAAGSQRRINEVRTDPLTKTEGSLMYSWLMLSTVLWAASTTEGRSKERRLRNKVASGSHGAATEERESSLVSGICLFP